MYDPNLYMQSNPQYLLQADFLGGGGVCARVAAELMLYRPVSLIFTVQDTAYI